MRSSVTSERRSSKTDSKTKSFSFKIPPQRSSYGQRLNRDFFTLENEIVKAGVPSVFDGAREIFSMISKHRHSISRNEFLDKMKSWGADKITGGMTIFMLLEPESDTDDHIDGESFVHFLHGIVALLFVSLDKSGDGLLQISELVRVAMIFRPDSTPEQQKVFLKSIDRDKDGVVDVRELFNIIIVEIIKDMELGSCSTLMSVVRAVHDTNSCDTQGANKDLYARHVESPLSKQAIEEIWMALLASKHEQLYSLRKYQKENKKIEESHVSGGVSSKHGIGGKGGSAGIKLGVVGGNLRYGRSRFGLHLTRKTFSLEGQPVRLGEWTVTDGIREIFRLLDVEKKHDLSIDDFKGLFLGAEDNPGALDILSFVKTNQHGHVTEEQWVDFFHSLCFNIFEFCDSSGNGALDADELIPISRVFRPKWTSEEHRMFFKTVDRNYDNQIDSPEWVNFVTVECIKDLESGNNNALMKLFTIAHESNIYDTLDINSDIANVASTINKSSVSFEPPPPGPALNYNNKKKPSELDAEVDTGVDIVNVHAHAVGGEALSKNPTRQIAPVKSTPSTNGKGDTSNASRKASELDAEVDTGVDIVNVHAHAIGGNALSKGPIRQSKGDMASIGVGAKDVAPSKSRVYSESGTSDAAIDDEVATTDDVPIAEIANMDSQLKSKADSFVNISLATCNDSNTLRDEIVSTDTLSQRSSLPTTTQPLKNDFSAQHYPNAYQLDNGFSLYWKIFGPSEISNVSEQMIEIVMVRPGFGPLGIGFCGASGTGYVFAVPQECYDRSVVINGQYFWVPEDVNGLPEERVGVILDQSGCYENNQTIFKFVRRLTLQNPKEPSILGGLQQIRYTTPESASDIFSRVDCGDMATQVTDVDFYEVSGSVAMGHGHQPGKNIATLSILPSSTGHEDHGKHVDSTSFNPSFYSCSREIPNMNLLLYWKILSPEENGNSKETVIEIVVISTKNGRQDLAIGFENSEGAWYIMGKFDVDGCAHPNAMSVSTLWTPRKSSQFVEKRQMQNVISASGGYRLVGRKTVLKFRRVLYSNKPKFANIIAGPQPVLFPTSNIRAKSGFLEGQIIDIEFYSVGLYKTPFNSSSTKVETKLSRSFNIGGYSKSRIVTEDGCGLTLYWRKLDASSPLASGFKDVVEIAAVRRGRGWLGIGFETGNDAASYIFGDIGLQATTFLKISNDFSIDPKEAMSSSLINSVAFYDPVEEYTVLKVVRAFGAAGDLTVIKPGPHPVRWAIPTIKSSSPVYNRSECPDLPTMKVEINFGEAAPSSAEVQPASLLASKSAAKSGLHLLSPGFNESFYPNYKSLRSGAVTIYWRILSSMEAGTDKDTVVEIVAIRKGLGCIGVGWSNRCNNIDGGAYVFGEVERQVVGVPTVALHTFWVPDKLDQAVQHTGTVGIIAGVGSYDREKDITLIKFRRFTGPMGDYFPQILKGRRPVRWAIPVPTVKNGEKFRRSDCGAMPLVTTDLEIIKDGVRINAGFIEKAMLFLDSSDDPADREGNVFMLQEGDGNTGDPVLTTQFEDTSGSVVNEDDGTGGYRVPGRGGPATSFGPSPTEIDAMEQLELSKSLRDRPDIDQEDLQKSDEKAAAILATERFRRILKQTGDGIEMIPDDGLTNDERVAVEIDEIIKSTTGELSDADTMSSVFNAEYYPHTCILSKGILDLYWRVLEQTEEIEMALVRAGRGWAAVGFPCGGGYAYIAGELITENDVILSSISVLEDDGVAPISNGTVGIVASSGAYDADTNSTIIKFRRPIAASGDVFPALTRGVVPLRFGYSDVSSSNLNKFDKNGLKDPIVEVDLFQLQQLMLAKDYNQHQTVISKDGEVVFDIWWKYHQHRHQNSNETDKKLSTVDDSFDYVEIMVATYGQRALAFAIGSPHDSLTRSFAICGTDVGVDSLSVTNWISSGANGSGAPVIGHIAGVISSASFYNPHEDRSYLKIRRIIKTGDKDVPDIVHEPMPCVFAVPPDDNVVDWESLVDDGPWEKAIKVSDNIKFLSHVGSINKAFYSSSKEVSVGVHLYWRVTLSDEQGVATVGDYVEFALSCKGRGWIAMAHGSDTMHRAYFYVGSLPENGDDVVVNCHYGDTPQSAPRFVPRSRAIISCGGSYDAAFNTTSLIVRRTFDSRDMLDPELPRSACNILWAHAKDADGASPTRESSMSEHSSMSRGVARIELFGLEHSIQPDLYSNARMLFQDPGTSLRLLWRVLSSDMSKQAHKAHEKKKDASKTHENDTHDDNDEDFKSRAVEIVLSRKGRGWMGIGFGFTTMKGSSFFVCESSKRKNASDMRVYSYFSSKGRGAPEFKYKEGILLSAAWYDPATDSTHMKVVRPIVSKNRFVIDLHGGHNDIIWALSPTKVGNVDISVPCRMSFHGTYRGTASIHFFGKSHTTKKVGVRGKVVDIIQSTNQGEKETPKDNEIAIDSIPFYKCVTKSAIVDAFFNRNAGLLLFLCGAWVVASTSWYYMDNAQYIPNPPSSYFAWGSFANRVMTAGCVAIIVIYLTRVFGSLTLAVWSYRMGLKVKAGMVTKTEMIARIRMELKERPVWYTEDWKELVRNWWERRQSYLQWTKDQTQTCKARFRPVVLFSLYFAICVIVGWVVWWTGPRVGSFKFSTAQDVFQIFVAFGTLNQPNQAVTFFLTFTMVLELAIFFFAIPFVHRPSLEQLRKHDKDVMEARLDGADVYGLNAAKSKYQEHVEAHEGRAETHTGHDHLEEIAVNDAEAHGHGGHGHGATKKDGHGHGEKDSDDGHETKEDAGHGHGDKKDDGHDRGSSLQSKTKAKLTSGTHMEASQDDGHGLGEKKKDDHDHGSSLFSKMKTILTSGALMETDPSSHDESVHAAIHTHEVDIKTEDIVKPPSGNVLHPAKEMFLKFTDGATTIKKADLIGHFREMGGDRRRGCLSVLSTIETADDHGSVSADCFANFLFKLVSLVFCVVDESHDGLLQTQELHVLAHALTNGHARAIRIFLRSVDRDCDGVVDIKELFSVVAIQILRSYRETGSPLALFGLCSFAHVNDVVGTQTYNKELYVRNRNKELSRTELKGLWLRIIENRKSDLLALRKSQIEIDAKKKSCGAVKLLPKCEFSPDGSRLLLHDCCLLIACHESCLDADSQSSFENTLRHALQVFPPEAIFVCDNGNALFPVDDTQFVVKSISLEYYPQGDRLINYVYIPEGNKTVALYWTSEIWIPACVDLNIFQDYQFAIIIDDDVPLGPATQLPYQDLYRDLRIKCVAFGISATTPDASSNVLVDLQDFEYKMCGFFKEFQANLGSTLCPHGAVNMWRRDVLGEYIFWNHDTVFHGEDLYMGILVHRECKGWKILYECRELVKTFAPEDITTLFRQRVRSWDLCSQRKVLTLLSLFLFYWKKQYLILKPFLLLEVLTTTIDWMRIFLLIQMVWTSDGAWSLLYIFVFMYIMAYIQYFLFCMWTLRHRPEDRPSVLIFILMPFYRTILLGFRFYALMENAIMYAPYVLRYARIRERMSKGGLAPLPPLPQLVKEWPYCDWRSVWNNTSKEETALVVRDAVLGAIIGERSTQVSFANGLHSQIPVKILSHIDRECEPSQTGVLVAIDPLFQFSSKFVFRSAVASAKLLTEAVVENVYVSNLVNLHQRFVEIAPNIWDISAADFEELLNKYVLHWEEDHAGVELLNKYSSKTPAISALFVGTMTSPKAGATSPKAGATSLLAAAKKSPEAASATSPSKPLSLKEKLNKKKHGLSMAMGVLAVCRSIFVELHRTNEPARHDRTRSVKHFLEHMLSTGHKNQCGEELALEISQHAQEKEMDRHHVGHGHGVVMPTKKKSHGHGDEDGSNVLVTDFDDHTPGKTTSSDDGHGHVKRVQPGRSSNRLIDDVLEKPVMSGGASFSPPLHTKHVDDDLRGSKGHLPSLKL